MKNIMSILCISVAATCHASTVSDATLLNRLVNEAFYKAKYNAYDALQTIRTQLKENAIYQSILSTPAGVNKLIKDLKNNAEIKQVFTTLDDVFEKYSRQDFTLGLGGKPGAINDRQKDVILLLLLNLPQTENVLLHPEENAKMLYGNRMYWANALKAIEEHSVDAPIAALLMDYLFNSFKAFAKGHPDNLKNPTILAQIKDFLELVKDQGSWKEKVSNELPELIRLVQSKDKNFIR